MATVDPSPAISWIEKAGNALHLHYTDGSTIRAFQGATSKQFIPENRNIPDPAPTDPGDYDSAGGIIITDSMLSASVTSVGFSTANVYGGVTNVVAGFNDAINGLYPGILDSKARAACLLGQCSIESGGYQYLSEIGGASKSYAPYYGRGWIQLTFESNYRAFGNWLVAKGLITDGEYFVNNPNEVATSTWAPYTALYYFTQNRWSPNGTLFQWCDAVSSPWHEISRAINRGNPTSSYAAYSEADRATSTDAVMAVTPDPTPVVGRFVKPTKNYTLTARFGQTGVWAKYHTGLDFAASLGTAVYAVADGVVHRAAMGFWQAGNNIVLKTSGGEDFAYWHLNSYLVPDGATVKAGTTIGTVGESGNAFGAHLHFEYYPTGYNGDIYQATDPEGWFSAKGITL